MIVRLTYFLLYSDLLCHNRRKNKNGIEIDIKILHTNKFHQIKFTFVAPKSLRNFSFFWCRNKGYFEESNLTVVENLFDLAFSSNVVILN